MAYKQYAPGQPTGPADTGTKLAPIEKVNGTERGSQTRSTAATGEPGRNSPIQKNRRGLAWQPSGVMAALLVRAACSNA